MPNRGTVRNDFKVKNNIFYSFAIIERNVFKQTFSSPLIFALKALIFLPTFVTLIFKALNPAE